MKDFSWVALAFVMFALILASNNDNANGVRTDWYDNDTLVAQRDGGNFISGDGVTMSGVDDAGNNQVDITADLDDCAASEILKRNVGDTAWECAVDATGSGGSAIALDIDDDGNLQSTDLTEIATTGDTNNIFTESAADKLLIALANNWPSADTADALDANPTDCSALNFATAIVANGDLTCAQPNFTDLAGTATDAQIPNTITIDLAALATALAANPTDCAATNFATTIAASGNLTCAQVAFTDLSGTAADAQIPNTITIDLAALATALASNPTDCGANTFAQSIVASGNLTCAAVDLGTADVTGTLDTSDHLNLTAGDHITLTADDLDVDDDFILNTGDVGTGVYDFGGATSFEIPNGTAPVVDTQGEIAVDTTDEQLLYYGTDTLMVLTPYLVPGLTIESPADADNILLPKLRDTITIVEVHCLVDPADTGESVVIDIQERDSSGDSPTSFDTTITCTNTGASDDGAISNATFDAGDWWSVDIGTVTGTVGQLVIAIWYTVDRE